MALELSNVNSIKNPRIEIKTLALAVGEESDKRLADAMNDGWEVMNIGTTSTVDQFEQAVLHWEIVKLFRLVDDEDDGGEVVAVEAEINLTPSPSPKGEGSKEEITETKELPKVIDEGEARPPIVPNDPGDKIVRRVVSGTVIGVVMEDVINGTTERESVETVSFAAALRSGAYSPAEMSQIGDREAIQRMSNFVWTRQTWGSRSWDGLVNRLPSAARA